MKLAIIMATFNRSKILKENISSLLKSSYNFELLVVDDGSNDNTEEIVKSFQDPRIKYFKR